MEPGAIHPVSSCLAGDLRVRGFLPKSLKPLVTNESDGTAIGAVPLGTNVRALASNPIGTVNLAVGVDQVQAVTTT